MNSNSPPEEAISGRLEQPPAFTQDNLDSECQKMKTGRRRPSNVDHNSHPYNFPKSQTKLTALMFKPAKKKSSILLKFFTLLALNSLFNQISYITNRVNHHYLDQRTDNDQASYPPQSFLSSVLARAKLPRIILAGAIECQSDADCVVDKVCHENKCICSREKPIEVEQERCLPRTLIDEPCSVSEQCLGDSECSEGICSCGMNAISLFNPSARIHYCHPKRGLNEQCNHDSQCPTNSYCSTKKSGCLCQNGYAEAVVNSDGKESRVCLAKFCTVSSSCETEFHECDDNKCKCLATHFDPTTAKCYKFGSSGGSSSDDLSSNGTDNGLVGGSEDTKGTIHTFFKDLTDNSDRMLLVLFIIVASSIIILLLIFIVVRKYYAGICWSTHKKEYEPNNKNAPKNGYFNKNSINNKSFRQKSGEVDDEENDDSGADSSNLVTNSDDKIGKFGSQHVKINMHDKRDEGHHYTTPLSTSTSTPV